MGTQPSLFVFDYRYYEETLVPPLRELLMGRPANEFLRGCLDRFARRSRNQTPFRPPGQGYCRYLAESGSGCCFCLRADLGLEPDHYCFWPHHVEYRPVEPQDGQCGLFAGMNRWSTNEEDFIELFNGLVGANCLSQERDLGRYMYLWDYRIATPDRDFDPSWIWDCPAFLTRATPLFLALYRRGCHLGSHCDPGGIMGWLTPDETRLLEEAIRVDLPPPPFARPESSADYDRWLDYEIYDDLLTVAEMCKLAVVTHSGLAASYLLFLDRCPWANLRKCCS